MGKTKKRTWGTTNKKMRRGIKSKRSKKSKKRGGRHDPRIDQAIDKDRQDQEKKIQEYDQQREVERQREAERQQQELRNNEEMDDTSDLFRNYGVSGLDIRG